MTTPKSPAKVTSPVKKVTSPANKVISPGNKPKVFRPEGKDYLVDLTNKDFPCIRKEGRTFTSVGGDVFNLPEGFSIIQNLGVGAYSSVVAAKNNRGDDVAIKKCSYVFARPEDGKRLLREVKLLKGLRHKNIIRLHDILIPLENDFNDLYFVMEKMDIDIYHYQQKKPMTEKEIKPIVYQILQALKYIHSAHVVHRDLKPDNVLLRVRDGTVKICDFNLARGFEPNPKTCVPMTSNISTRWYRSPEILLDNRRYTVSTDIWSLGCIFAEMLTGVTLFPGDTQVDMLDKIVQALPLRTEDTPLDWIENAEMRETVRGMIEKSDHLDHIDEMIPAHTSVEAKAFLRRMLKFDPESRPTVDRLLEDPFMKDLYNPSACLQSSHIFKWKFDDLAPTDTTLRQLFWREIMALHPEARQLFQDRAQA